ncbi:hypothetical protein PLANPX_1707 [Lacipirellula parvula]|uniref:Uncharacterized protein n=2 Tax=Lacipirellula parvula TaxID=2650471 RepID=A0A5K7X6V0_9BACT|nr:hypothetical protein PLANPX_1707 [Lacipirellula parvula]
MWFITTMVLAYRLEFKRSTIVTSGLALAALTIVSFVSRRSAEDREMGARDAIVHFDRRGQDHLIRSMSNFRRQPSYRFVLFSRFEDAAWLVSCIYIVLTRYFFEI